MLLTNVLIANCEFDLDHSSRLDSPVAGIFHMFMKVRMLGPCFSVIATKSSFAIVIGLNGHNK